MTLEGAVVSASLFGPPAFAFVVFVRNGRSWVRSFVDSLYVFAVCMMVMIGLVSVHEGLGLFGDGIAFALPIFVGICLWLLMNPRFREGLRRISAAINLDDDMDRDRR
jgi:hypothetical protein